VHHSLVRIIDHHGLVDLDERLEPDVLAHDVPDEWIPVITKDLLCHERVVIPRPERVHLAEVVQHGCPVHCSEIDGKSGHLQG